MASLQLYYPDFTEDKPEESKTTYFLYNGAIEEDEDPADYLRPVKAVRVA